MTRKHFNAIAEALLDSRPDMHYFDNEAEYAASYSQWERDVVAMSGVCRQFNGLFDSYRFHSAAGIAS